MSLDCMYIYTDASFSKNHGLAVLGYALFQNQQEHDDILLSNKNIVLSVVQETNNIRAEIRASLLALQKCTESCAVTLYTDCQNIVNLISRRSRLEKTHFVSQSSGQVLANADLYKEFYALYDRMRPEVVWIKGHASKSKQKTDKVQKNFSSLDKEVRRFLRETVVAHES